ncbi:S9 family peptidase [Sphingomonas sp. AR_OL41]|uniref:alpha/beta hydrolase family protein n=1 Tax=Sphingomonas sp. AR_OL41 TaxID=3042729 RepID=UPI00247FC718|nr:S9 family peptidase [Sphingomonas sp. AR_OL41]MDH7975453.1 S9 family peptidase [Sphingomonas sp. AR_OL41]
MKLARLTWPVALCLFAATGGGAADPSAPPRIPIEAFAQLPFLDAPVISPDGTHVAARSLETNKAGLVIFDPADAAHDSRFIPTGENKVLDLNWAGPHRVLVTLGSKANYDGMELPVARLFSVDTATGAVTRLDRKSRGFLGGDVLYTDPAGAWLLVSSQDDVFSTPSVKRVDLATGVATTVEKARDDVWAWYADGAGVVRAGIAYDDDRWKIWYRATATEPLRVIKGKVGKDDSGSVDSLRFLAGDSSGLIVTNGRTGRFAAYHYDFKTGTVGEAIYENPDVDISSVMVDPITGIVSGINYEDDRRRVMWLDPGMRAIQARIDRLLPGAENSIVSRSDNAKRVLVWSGGAADPGTYYLFDLAAGRMAPFAQPYDKLEGVQLAPVAPVRYAARDGLTIPAYLTMPLHRGDKGLPLIVMPHGGPFARDDWEYDSFVQFLANRGYVVLQPEFRGSTGYGKAFVEKGYGQWGRKMQDDVDDGVDWLVKSGKVDAKRVCIMGASYGGYAALWGAIRNPEKYRCAISLAGVTDIAAILRYDRRFFSAPRYFREWQTKIAGEDKIDLDTVSPLAQASRLTIPVLIAQGEKDSNVPPRQGHAMVDALTKRHADVESVFYKEAEHGFTKPEDMADYLRRVEAFLAKHNPA